MLNVFNNNIVTMVCTFADKMHQVRRGNWKTLKAGTGMETEKIVINTNDIQYNYTLEKVIHTSTSDIQYNSY